MHAAGQKDAGGHKGVGQDRSLCSHYMLISLAVAIYFKIDGTENLVLKNSEILTEPAGPPPQKVLRTPLV